MKHARTLLTVGVLGTIAVVGLLIGNEPVTYIAVGALAGYLGKVNGTTQTTERTVT